MGDSGWVTISPDGQSAKEQLENQLAAQLSLQDAKPKVEKEQSDNNEEQNENGSTIQETPEGSAASVDDKDEENYKNASDDDDNDVTGDIDDVNDDISDKDTDISRKKKISPLKFFKRIGLKDTSTTGASEEDGKGLERLPSKSKARRTSQIPMELQVDSLPQIFITKYLGSDVCTGLWGIQHTHGPVTNMVDNVGKMKKNEDLPLVQLHISRKGRW